MIITSNKALRIVSNHAVLKEVPELLAAVEAYRAAEKAANAKADCPSCMRTQFFGEVEKRALAAIRSLPKDAIFRLKSFLGTKKLYLNVPKPGAKGELVPLD